jgi:hypothetical protein
MARSWALLLSIMMGVTRVCPRLSCCEGGQAAASQYLRRNLPAGIILVAISSTPFNPDSFLNDNSTS